MKLLGHPVVKSIQVFPRQIRQKMPVNKKSIFDWYVFFFCASNLLTLGWLCQSIHRVEADLLDLSTGQAHNPESCSEHGEARLHGPGYPFLPTPPPQSDGFRVESNVRDGITGCDRWPALDTCQDNLKNRVHPGWFALGSLFKNTFDMRHISIILPAHHFCQLKSWIPSQRGQVVW